MNPSAFFSYSWDDENHKRWVRDLAARLRKDSIDVKLDQWETAPGDQLPHFMEKSIRENDYVVIVCTPNYKHKSDNRTGGVGYEGDIMTSEIFVGKNQRKFIPILRGDRTGSLPSWLAGKYFVDFTSTTFYEQSYSDLLTTILNARETAPPLGEPKTSITPIVANKTNNKTDPFEFIDIKIKGVIVDEVTSPRNDGTAGSALYNVPFELSAEPPMEWRHLFVNNWDRPPEFSTRHRPGIATVYGRKVSLNGTTIDEVEQVHRKTLILALNETNKQMRQIMESRRSEHLQKESRANQHRENIKNVSDRLKFDD
jgi:TIR domain